MKFKEPLPPSSGGEEEKMIELSFDTLLLIILLSLLIGILLFSFLAAYIVNNRWHR